MTQLRCSGETTGIKGDEYALSTLADHCPKCPARFVNNVYVTDGISHILPGLC